ncbi:MAG: lactate racemase domain-containing protein [bacterium]
MPLPPSLAAGRRCDCSRCSRSSSSARNYGVDDIHIIVAICLHRRMTGPEIKRMVGDKIFDAYWPDRLYNHDAGSTTSSGWASPRG